MRRMIVLGVVILAFATLAAAELSPQYRDWAKTPAGFLLTKAEAKAFALVTTDEQAQKFVDLFWAKRDPDLATPLNEFKLEFETRVATADARFGFLDVKGSRSDRGKVLVVLGTPPRIWQADKVPEYGVAAPSEGTSGTRLTTDKPTSERWCYNRPEKGLDPKACDFIFFFIERTRGAGDFVLDPAEASNGIAQAYLSRSVDRLVLHPELTEPPKYETFAGMATATAEQMAILDGPGLPWPANAVAYATSGLLSEAVPALWLSLQLPADAPEASEVVARLVRDNPREVVASFAGPVSPRAVAGGRLYEVSLQAPAGNWTLEAALLANGAAVAGTSVIATVEAVPPSGTYVSPLYWGVDVVQDSEPHQGDAFSVGGWHVTPRLTGQYTPAELLSYFSFLVRPGVDEQREAHANVQMTLSHGQTKVAELPPQPATLTRIFGDLWMVGSALPLEAIKKSGFYRLDVTLHDTVSDMKRTTRIPLRVAVPAGTTPAAAPVPPTGAPGE